MNPTWTSDCGRVQLYLGDCREILPTLGKVDAVVTDPPYGMKLDTDNSRFTGGNESRLGRMAGTGLGAGIFGDSDPFDPSPWIQFPSVVLFGSNHFAARLPVGTTLVWLKRNDDAFGSFLSDAEVAWMKGGHGVYCNRDLSMAAEARSRQHPCQKPVSLMVWVLEKVGVPSGAIVFDPYMGSASTAIACIRTGRRFIGIEISERYFQIAKERIQRELSQPFIPSLEPQASPVALLLPGV